MFTIFAFEEFCCRKLFTRIGTGSTSNAYEEASTTKDTQAKKVTRVGDFVFLW